MTKIIYDFMIQLIREVNYCLMKWKMKFSSLILMPIPSYCFYNLGILNSILRMTHSHTFSAPSVPNMMLNQQQNEAIERLVTQATTWCGLNGLLYADSSSSWNHAPIALLPNSFSNSAFIYAQEVAPIFNTLIDNISRDKDFLVSNLIKVAENDDFISKLLDIYKTIPDDIVANSINLGIHRSDYMLQAKTNPAEDTLLQVELNTIASSFGCLSKKVGELHRYLLLRSANVEIVKTLLKECTDKLSCDPDTASSMIPENTSIRILAFALAMAHFIFGDNSAVVLFIVQPHERNIADQRLLEAELWTSHGIRVEFMTLSEIAMHSKLSTDGNADLLIAPPGRGGTGSGSGAEDLRVSVAYFRAGYAPTDYPSELEWDARIIIERSSAVKCPTVGYQLAGTKKIQQILCETGQVERFILNPDDSSLLRKCFAVQYSLGPAHSVSGETSIAIEEAIKDGSNWVLKPQREGGGNNLYNHQLSEFLKLNINNDILSGYVLMQRIFPRTQRTLFLKNGKASWATSISELGMYSVFLGAGNAAAPVLNEAAGYLVRTKAEGVDEGGVATGYSVLNSIILEDYSKCRY